GLLRQINIYEPPAPRKIRPEIPADLETVILKAMAKNRDDRYATAEALADDLRCVLDGKPTQARPPTLADRLLKWSRRHRRLVAGTLAALVLVCVGLAATTLLVMREQR